MDWPDNQLRCNGVWTLRCAVADRMSVHNEWTAASAGVYVRYVEAVLFQKELTPAWGTCASACVSFFVYFLHTTIWKRINSLAVKRRITCEDSGSNPDRSSSFFIC